MTDIEISNKYKLENICKIAKKLKLKKNEIFLFGDKFAKILNYNKKRKRGKLILVTAINPTSAGIGKTTVSIGLADALDLMKKNVALSLREPSLGPVFGIKGGATGGGYSQIVPMEDINLHFTGDFHAITSANNLLSSLIDNHIYHGNELKIKEVVFKRCLDINDRALRNIVVSFGSDIERSEGFTITAASEIMAILSLSKDFNDLKKRLGNILVGFNSKNKPIYAKELKAENAMAILLKDAIKPNLVQTLGKVPAIVHCGPFANIAHGCSSLIGTNFAVNNADYAITEAGFGSDLGAEKFFDIVCRVGELEPNCIVLVATIKALKLHGGELKDSPNKNGVSALKKGFSNLDAHINILRNYNIPFVVALNLYIDDDKKEIEIVKQHLESLKIPFETCDVWKHGGKGALSLAKKVIDLCKKFNNQVKFLYEINCSLKKKIRILAKKVYGTDNITYSNCADKKIRLIKKLKLMNLPICVAKTQYSLSDNPKLIGAKKNFNLYIRDIEIRSGAGYLVVLLGDMLLMPGLSKVPAATKMVIDENHIIHGLF